uniref:Uncharacterized protein n=1 Tax=viral metagenome TaxID=1070528 RepID=A0A6M3IHA0_9ZZZZ
MAVNFVTEITTPGQEVYYRYVNNFGSLVLERFPAIRKTRCGVWLKVGDEEKLVINSAMKRFAYPTREEALVNFIKRTERHIMLARFNLECTEIALRSAIRAQQREQDDTD